MEDLYELSAELSMKFDDEDDGKLIHTPDGHGLGRAAERRFNFELVNKLNRTILKCFGEFCQLDMSVSHETNCQIHKRGSRERAHSDCQCGSANTKRKPSRWPRLVLIVFVYCCLRLSINIYYQYLYDYHRIRLEWAIFRLIESKSSLASEVLNLEVKFWQDHVHQSRTRLKSLGAPHIGATIAAECIYITILMLGYSSYILGAIYFNFITPFDFYLAWMMLDRPTEQRACNEMIRLEVERFVASSRNYCSIHLARAKACSNLERMALLMEHFRFRHKLLVGQFRMLAANGALRPLNRTPDWFDKLALAYCLFCIGCIIWSLFFDTVLYLLVPKLANFLIESQPMDLLVNLELITIAFIIVVAMIFYLSITMISCLDQIVLVRKLNRLLTDCICLNNYQFYARGAAGRQPPTDISHWLATAKRTSSWPLFNHCPGQTLEPDCQSIERTEMNTNLVLAVLHYKIFIRQLKPIQRPVGFVSFVAIVLLLLHPVLVRIHVPYMESQNLQNNYYIVILIVAVFVNCLVGPLCYINSRCLNLYKSLFSLLAHTLDVEQSNEFQSASFASSRSSSPSVSRTTAAATTTSQSLHQPLPPACRPIYDPHTVWILRKELEHPDELILQFETKCLGLKMTYANLVRIYFWLGILVLSISVEPAQRWQGGGNQLLGRLLSDPLGFYGNT